MNERLQLLPGHARQAGQAAEIVASRGDTLVAIARDFDRLSNFKQHYPEKVVHVELDVTDMRAAQYAVDTAVRTFGRLDVLLNNAGHAHVAPFEQTTEADFKAEIDTNFYGVVNLTRAALPYMRRQRSGHIINISSSSARFGSPGATACGPAKWAVSGFTASLAKEVLPFGVKAIAIEPDSMRTNWTRVARGHVPLLLDEYDPSIGEIMRMTETYAGNEPGNPDKVADVIFDLSRADDLPEQLILGSDALARVAKSDAVQSAAALRWDKISRSTDFE